MNHNHNYQEERKSPEWMLWRRAIIIKYKGRCRDCHSPDNLEVHHKVYINDRAVWEYSDIDLAVLCTKCHCKIHSFSRVHNVNRISEHEYEYLSKWKIEYDKDRIKK